MISRYLREVKPGFGGFDESYEAAEVVFAGIPLDLTSSCRPGTRFAPAKIREASMNLETYVMPRLDVFEHLHVSDIGDLDLIGADMTAAGERIREVVRKLRRDGKIPALMGGEHTLTYFALRAFDDVYLLQFDAHRDLREEYRGKRVCHATVTRRVLERLPPERLIQLGTRSCSKEEEEFAREVGIRTFTAEDLLEDLRGVADKVRELVGDSPVYLTLDLDVLDPAFAPAVSTPEPGGLSTLDLLKFARGLGGMRICGFDVVELVPPYDNGITAFVAARALYEILASVAESGTD
ncbi:MAG: agmatinase [Hadesarchaea archaeon]|nr:agmatinase [Hadesarchaea archaeon]